MWYTDVLVPGPIQGWVDRGHGENSRKIPENAEIRPKIPEKFRVKNPGFLKIQNSKVHVFKSPRTEIPDGIPVSPVQYRKSTPVRHGCPTRKLGKKIYGSRWGGGSGCLGVARAGLAWRRPSDTVMPRRAGGPGKGRGWDGGHGGSGPAAVRKKIIGPAVVPGPRGRGGGVGDQGHGGGDRLFTATTRGMLDVPVAGWTGRTGTVLHGRRKVG